MEKKMDSLTSNESYNKKKKKLVKSTVKSSKEFNKGAWTAEEDQKLAEVIAVNGPQRWKSIAAKAGLNRCGKSCRLRWLNYLRPNIKRGNITDQEEDLILRLHKLLGNRWSLIAGRLPGRTDNEIKNYWNSHLSKRINQEKKPRSGLEKERSRLQETDNNSIKTAQGKKETEISITTTLSLDQAIPFRKSESFNVDDFFDFSNENPLNLEWVSRFVELDHQRSNNNNNIM